jgi:hypothetical protein
MTHRFVQADRTVARLNGSFAPLHFAAVTAARTGRRLVQMFGVLLLQLLIDCACGQLADLMANLFNLRKTEMKWNSLLTKPLFGNQLRQLL